MSAIVKLYSNKSGEITRFLEHFEEKSSSKRI